MNNDDGHVLLSGRFDGGHKECIIRDLYASLGRDYPEVNPFIVDAGPGQRFGPLTVDGLQNMYAMIAVIFDDYGEQTQSRFCTYYEVDFAYNNNIPIIPLQFVPNSEFPPTKGVNMNRVASPPDLVRINWYDKTWNADECAKEVAQALSRFRPGLAAQPDLSLPVPAGRVAISNLKLQQLGLSGLVGRYEGHDICVAVGADFEFQSDENRSRMFWTIIPIGDEFNILGESDLYLCRLDECLTIRDDNGIVIDFHWVRSKESDSPQIDHAALWSITPSRGSFHIVHATSGEYLHTIITKQGVAFAASVGESLDRESSSAMWSILPSHEAEQQWFHK